MENGVAFGEQSSRKVKWVGTVSRNNHVEGFRGKKTTTAKGG